MFEKSYSSEIPSPAQTVFDWHARPGAFQRLTPPWMDVRLREHEGIRDGDKAVMRVGLGPVSVKWVAEHRGFEAGRQFEDVQVKGPFRSWTHTHRMEPLGNDRCRLHDEIAYELPFGNLGQTLGASMVSDRLDRQFAYRHRVTRSDLAVHTAYPLDRPLRIAVTGASGMIGSQVLSFFRTGGHEVVRMVRERPKEKDAGGERLVYWNHREAEIELEKLENLDAVIHLSGESVVSARWNDEKRMRIFGSRVKSTDFLSRSLARLKQPPRVLITASGINYYGDRSDEVLTEASAPGDSGFLTAVAQEWEAASAPAADAGIRTVHTRFGLVLDPQGGLLDAMLLPFRLGLGGRVGAGDRYVSWVAVDDVLYALMHVIHTPDLEGAVNVTSPQPVTMAAFSRTLADVLNRPSFFRVPDFIMRLLLGEAADETVLTSLRVMPEALRANGFSFHYPDLDSALRHMLGRTLQPLEGS